MSKPNGIVATVTKAARQPDRASLPCRPFDEPVLPMLRRCAAPDEAAMVASRGILALSVRCAEGPKDLAPSASFLSSLVNVEKAL